VKAAYVKSTTNYDAWSEEQKKSVNLDAKAMNALFSAFNKRRIQSCVNGHINASNMTNTTGNTRKYKQSKRI